MSSPLNNDKAFMYVCMYQCHSME